jgi:hypothetical protein
MAASLHPIRLLSRTDVEITTLYHSFYLIEYIKESNDTRTIQRIPHERSKMDIIESGLKIFVLDAANDSVSSEIAGNFVVTSSDGLRYFAFFRAFNNRIFVSVSQISSMSFSRKVFDLLENEKKDTLPIVLLTLCQLPILPCAGLRYDLEMSHGTATLNYSVAEQPEDCDIDLIVSQLMTPSMLVEAWESVILERKVLVVSVVDSVVTACCEFIRRMALPLVMVNTYVPLLPIQLIHTVEAPFPYLVGANTNTLREHQVDLSDTVVIDLDNRSVLHPKPKSSTPIPCAPANMILHLKQEINSILLQPLGHWFNRPSDNPDSWMHSDVRIAYGVSAAIRDIHNLHESCSSQVLQLFIRTNISLFCSRTCNIKACFRISDEGTSVGLSSGSTVGRNSMRASAQHSEEPGVFDRESVFARKQSKGFMQSGNVISGFMQLLKDPLVEPAPSVSPVISSPSSISSKHNNVASVAMTSIFIPCWLEFDSFAFAVYEYADDLPMVYIANTDIMSVSSLSREPEGHVFELKGKDQSVHKFTCTDPESRSQWIAAIEVQIALCKVASNIGLPPSSIASTDVDPQYRRGSQIVPGLDREAGTSLLSSPGTQAAPMDSYNVDPFAMEPFPALGLVTPTSVIEDGGGNVSKEEASFRFYAMKTQMLNSLLTQLESPEFLQVFKELGITVNGLIRNHSIFRSRMNQLSWTSGSIEGAILEKLRFMDEIETDEETEKKMKELVENLTLEYDMSLSNGDDDTLLCDRRTNSMRGAADISMSRLSIASVKIADFAAKLANSEGDLHRSSLVAATEDSPDYESSLALAADEEMVSEKIAGKPPTTAIGRRIFNSLKSGFFGRGSELKESSSLTKVHFMDIRFLLCCLT